MHNDMLDLYWQSLCGFLENDLVIRLIQEPTGNTTRLSLYVMTLHTPSDYRGERDLAIRKNFQQLVTAHYVLKRGRTVRATFGVTGRHGDTIYRLKTTLAGWLMVPEWYTDRAVVAISRESKDAEWQTMSTIELVRHLAQLEGCLAQASHEELQAEWNLPDPEAVRTLRKRLGGFITGRIDRLTRAIAQVGQMARQV